MLDDTCYFIPCSHAKQAAILVSLLNDPICLNYIQSIIFLDAKRPVTKKLLQRINIAALFELVEQQSLITKANIELKRLEETNNQNFVEKIALDDFLYEYIPGTSLQRTQSDNKTQQLAIQWIVAS